MSNARSTAVGVQAEIMKGWKPNLYLTNMSMAYFANPEDFVAPSVFPICPVQQSKESYYIFSKADLARDNVRRKPDYGKVQPAIFSETDATYACNPTRNQVRVRRVQTPALHRRSKTRSWTYLRSR